MDACFIQIYDYQCLCHAHESKPHTNILITNNLLKLKQEKVTYEYDDENNFLYAKSYNKRKLFTITVGELRNLFSHVKDIILDVMIYNYKIYIIADKEEIIFESYIDYDKNVVRVPLEINFSKDFLIKNCLNQE